MGTDRGVWCGLVVERQRPRVVAPTAVKTAARILGGQPSHLALNRVSVEMGGGHP